MVRPTVNPLTRFWGRVTCADDNDCWKLRGSLSGGGYGHFWNGERRMPAHRFIYEHLYGSVPEGFELDHLCRNRWCVNPAHLQVVTHSENVRRGLTPLLNKIRGNSITHCPHGHPYDETNTVYTREGWRDCKICRKVSKLLYRRKIGLLLNLGWWANQSRGVAGGIIGICKQFFKFSSGGVSL